MKAAEPGLSTVELPDGSLVVPQADENGQMKVAFDSDDTSGLATQVTAAAILAKLSADPATQTTLAALLAAINAARATGYTISRVRGVLAGGASAVLIAGTAGKKTAVFALQVELAAGASYTVTEETSGTVHDGGAVSKVRESAGVLGVPFILAGTADKDLSINAVTAGVTYQATVGIEV